MTTAEICPAKVYLSGRNSGPGLPRRNLRFPRALPIAPPLVSVSCSMFPSRASSGAQRESSFQVDRARVRRQAGDGRRDRRRKIRHHVPVAGAADARHACRGRRRSRRGAGAQPAQDRGLAGWRLRRRVARRRAQGAHDFGHRQRRGLDRRSAHRGDRGGDRRARRRHPSRADVDRPRQAHRHGQCGSRRGGGPAAGAQGQGGGRGLFAGLGRSAGADLRARRLGARRRLQGRSAPAKARATSRIITSPIPTMSGTSSTNI